MLETANHATRDVAALDAARDRMALMQERFDMEPTAVMRHNGYVLNIVSTAFMPFRFLTGLFRMNVEGVPELDTSWTFKMLCGTSVVFGLILFLLYCTLKWL